MDSGYASDNNIYKFKYTGRITLVDKLGSILVELRKKPT
jgi:hypothetical protein